MDLRLAGKTAIVTGASRGIGLAITRGLLGEGVRVVGAARETTPELLALDGELVPVIADLTAADGPATVVSEAASNSGRPGAGIVHRSYSSSDSARLIALPNAYRNCSAVSVTALCRFAGFLNTGSVARSADSGTGSTPLIWAASIATAAAARSWPSSFCAIIPPNE